MRSDLDKGAAGNTWLIIALYFVHLSHIYSSHICRTGAIKGAWESAPLRTSLDGDDVIIKLSLVHLSLTLMPDICL